MDSSCLLLLNRQALRSKRNTVARTDGWTETWEGFIAQVSVGQV